MSRPQPAIRTADERTMLEGMLEWYREGVVAKVGGMSAAAVSDSPVPSGTNAAGLLKHLAYVEDVWFTARLGRQPLPEPWLSAPFDVDPDWEFHSAGDDGPHALLGLYADACVRSRAVAASHELDAVGEVRGEDFSLRFALLHLIEETARHLGHLDLLRELADGSVGD